MIYHYRDSATDETNCTTLNGWTTCAQDFIDRII